jgi:hypothetical protein
MSVLTSIYVMAIWWGGSGMQNRLRSIMGRGTIIGTGSVSAHTGDYIAVTTQCERGFCMFTIEKGTKNYEQNFVCDSFTNHGGTFR